MTNQFSVDKKHQFSVLAASLAVTNQFSVLAHQFSILDCQFSGDKAVFLVRFMSSEIERRVRQPAWQGQLQKK